LEETLKHFTKKRVKIESYGWPGKDCLIIKKEHNLKKKKSLFVSAVKPRTKLKTKEDRSKVIKQEIIINQCKSKL